MAQTAPRLSRVSNRFVTWLDDASSSMFPQEKLRIEFPNHLMFFDWDFWDVFESSSSKDAFWDFFGHMWLGILWDVNQREAPRSCLWFVTSGRIIWICKRFIPLGWKSMSKLYVGLYIYRWLYIYIYDINDICLLPCLSTIGCSTWHDATFVVLSNRRAPDFHQPNCFPAVCKGFNVVTWRWSLNMAPQWSQKITWYNRSRMINND